MKVLILSDLHIEHRPCWELPDLFPDFDVAVFAGDIHSPPAEAVRELSTTPALFGKPIIYVPGNHEFYYGSIGPRIADGIAARRGTNVHLLDRASVVIDGVRFVGAILWTDYALYGDSEDVREGCMTAAECGLNDHHLIRHDLRRFTATDALERHKADLVFIESELSKPFDGPTVVVTHHAPHPDSVAPQFVNDTLTPAFASDLTEAIERFSPDLWMHGHMHNSSDYMVGKTRVICNPKGYGPLYPSGLPENTEFNEELIVEV